MLFITDLIAGLSSTVLRVVAYIFLRWVCLSSAAILTDTNQLYLDSWPCKINRCSIKGYSNEIK